MPAQIPDLIDKVDTFEIIRDELAAILLTESAEQVALATAATDKNPNHWRLRIFSERTNPWEEFQDPAATDDETPAPFVAPIVNVSFADESYDYGASNTVERQKATATYNIDCYGYGVAEDDLDGGHRPGDAQAALECHRAVRLVRNILMSGPYTYLGLRGTVWRRSIQTITAFRPAGDEQAVQQVAAARLTVQVEFNEFAPQYRGAPLELISLTVKRAETGEIYLTADYGEED